MIKVLKKEEFSKEVLDTISAKKIGGMEAILLLMDKYDIEYENISKLIDKSLKEAIEYEATELKMLKSNKLPI